MLRLTLADTEELTLQEALKHHPKAYVRERAAALLKIAHGLSGRQVALYGLLRSRRDDTIYDWVRRYQQEGIAGLYLKAGRGRKSAFSPTESRAGSTTA